MGFRYNLRSMRESSSVVTRFAPSPTGELHIGGARTALFAWAYAQRHHGQFLLRMEDTDQSRSSQASADRILRDLAWLGLKADNQDASDSSEGIPRQSDRLALYAEHVDRLLAAGQAYQDDGAVRFRMDQAVTFDDAVYGQITVQADDLEDFVIRKGDGFPTFHLAVVVDDALMGVTHVIRGQEHLSNTSKHAALYDALGYERPVWAHTPSILNPDGSKMSKRDKAKAARKAAKDAGLNASSLISQEIPENHIHDFLDKKSDANEVALAIADHLGLALPEIDVADFRNSGYLPGPLLNYLSLLGWNPGEDREQFDLAFMAEHFGLERINKANSKFDREKLKHFSFEVLQAMPTEALTQHLKKQLPEFVQPFDDAQISLLVSMYRPRAQTLNDYAQMGRFFVEAPAGYADKPVRKHLLKNEGEGLTLLRAFGEVLAKVTDWQGPVLHGLIESFVAEKQLKNMGSIAQPLRVALTGDAVSPPMDQTLELLGKAQTLERIGRCLEAHA